jgi:RNA methyltransferase, TrmH family
VTEEAIAKPEIASLVRQAQQDAIVLSTGVFAAIADADTPQGIAAEIEIPKARLAKGDYVFLEGVQDAGNVGAIIRSAAGFGAGAVVLDRACADAWSPKVLRAAAGGHFGLSVQQVAQLEDALDGFPGKLACTVARGGRKPGPVAGQVGWIFGSEGAGVSPALQERAALRITVPMAPGTESLNVAATAAICLYARASTPGAGS